MVRHLRAVPGASEFAIPDKIEYRTARNRSNVNQKDLTELGILGVLNEWEALSLETIHDRLQHNFGSYWTYSYGTLLPRVTQLEEDGYVDVAKGSDDSFPGDSVDGQTFEITPTGRERLQALLRQPLAALEDPTQRHKLMIKLGFIHHLPPDERTEELDSLIDRLHEFRREWVEALEAHDDETMEPFAAHGYRVRLIELSIEIIDTITRWLEDVRAEAQSASLET